jgi:hypothetical protein
LRLQLLLLLEDADAAGRAKKARSKLFSHQQRAAAKQFILQLLPRQQMMRALRSVQQKRAIHCCRTNSALP